METVVDAGAAPASETVVSPPGTNGAGETVVVTREQSPIEAREAADAKLNDELAAIWNKNHPDRQANGQFKARDTNGAQPPEGQEATPEAAATEGAAKEGATVSADQAAEAKIEQAKVPAIDPPHSWSAEMKAKWPTLPPDVQTYVAQRDKEGFQAITRAGEQVKQYEQELESRKPLDQLFEVYKDDFARRGISPAQGVAVLLDAQRKLDANPVAALVQIGLTYGIDLRPVFQQPGAQQQLQVQEDPRIAQLASMVQELKAELGEQKSRTSEREKAEQDALLSKHTKLVDDFAKDKPYFADVQDDIMAMVQVLKGQDPTKPAADVLSEAYERATWANPAIRARILSDQRAKEEKDRQAEAQAKAKQAQLSASVNVKSGSAAASPKTMDDTLKGIARKVYGHDGQSAT